MFEVQLFSNTNAGANATSIPYVLGDLRDYSIEVTFSSATLNGSLSLEVSNGGVTFIPIVESVQAVSSGAGHMWNVFGGNYKLVRVAWTRTSGSGTLTAAFLLKEFPIKWG